MAWTLLIKPQRGWYNPSTTQQVTRWQINISRNLWVVIAGLHWPHKEGCWRCMTNSASRSNHQCPCPKKGTILQGWCLGQLMLPGIKLSDQMAWLQICFLIVSYQNIHPSYTPDSIAVVLYPYQYSKSQRCKPDFCEPKMHRASFLLTWGATRFARVSSHKEVTRVDDLRSDDQKEKTVLLQHLSPPQQ